MALRVIYAHATDEKSALEFLQQRAVIRQTPPNCSACGKLMTLVKSGKGDERIFRCKTHKGNKLSLKKNSFCEDSSLKFTQIVELLCLWSFKIPVCSVIALTDLSNITVMRWYSFFKKICSHHLNNNPRKIGGPGVVVEVDESIIARRKFRVGDSVEEGWVFGGICPNTGEGFLRHITDKSEATLLPLIVKHVKPGSIIHSRSSPSLRGIANLPVNPPIQHLVLGNFIDPVSGTCTNRVLRFWKTCKKHFRCVPNSRNSSYNLNLDEYMWRQQFGKTGEEALDNLLLHLSQWFPLT